ncbi:MAG: hypothetical protein GX971_06270 [Firmicutes bacterium]|nr:hypothetical protein [Bacillota bacterium]
MIRRIRVFPLLLGLLVMATGIVWAEEKVGTLEITGVPTDQVTGRYDRQAQVFYADVTAFEDALIQVVFEEVQIIGKQMEWRTEDNYLIFSVGAKLTKDDFELTGDTIEYYGDESKLEATGNVVVTTEDATVYANELVYNEETDEALFIGQVRVIFEDGVLEGERFLMLLEKSELQFFGSFQGEFNSESTTSNK